MEAKRFTSFQPGQYSYNANNNSNNNNNNNNDGRSQQHSFHSGGGGYGAQANNFGGGGGGNNRSSSFGSNAPAAMDGAAAAAGGFDRGAGMSKSFGNSPDDKMQKKRDPQTLLPATIKQILTCDSRDQKFRIDGKDLSQVALVGYVLKVDVQPTNVSYVLDDGTGKITVRLYIDQEDLRKRSAVREGSYVRVIGSVRPYQSEKSVVGFQLIPVTDFNEITFHMLDVIHCHLLNTRGAPNAGVKSEAGPSGAGPSSSGSATNPSGMVVGHDAFTQIQSSILAVFEHQSNLSENGTSVQDVCKSLPQHTPEDIRRAIEFLSDEGHLYSTVDENHFKSTNSAS